ncbi:MAG: hypothetical protein ACKPKO_51440, partial [Candidatus Fonsibacter sp.]
FYHYDWGNIQGGVISHSNQLICALKLLFPPALTKQYMYGNGSAWRHYNKDINRKLVCQIGRRRNPILDGRRLNFVVPNRTAQVLSLRLGKHSRRRDIAQ